MKKFGAGLIARKETNPNDALMKQVDPGLHHEYELTEFYDHLAEQYTYRKHFED